MREEGEKRRRARRKSYHTQKKSPIPTIIILRSVFMIFPFSMLRINVDGLEEEKKEDHVLGAIENFA